MMSFIRTLVTVGVVLQTSVPAVGARISLNDRSKVTPIQKVLEMMAQALAKGKKEKQVEEVEFAKFKAFCEDVISDSTKAIADAAAKIEQLNADILKAESDAKTLGDEIKALEVAVATDEKDLADATAIRAKEKEDYDASHADYTESIDAIERAIVALKKRQGDIPQLLQIQNSKVIPEKTKALIQSFIEMSSQADDELANHADLLDSSLQPAANAYESQSGGIVAMLEKLLHKFEDELFALEKAEMTLQANFDMLAQKLTGSIKDGKTDISTKTAMKAQRLEDAAAAKGVLETTTAGKMEDEKTLRDTKSECYTRSDEYEKNQVTRKGEITAITKAMEILSSPAVSGNDPRALLAQTATSLLQVEVTQHLRSPERSRVVAFLQSKAQKIGSRYLLLIAARAADDPFKKVKKMIKDMIVKLMEEANAEAEQKGFCDAEMATNKMTRDIKSEKVDELTASIEEHTAEKEKLTTEIADLSAAIAELKEKQAEATAIRDEEKAKNMGVIADAQAGQKAVESAIKVLKDFYNSQSFLQGEGAFLQGKTTMTENMNEAIKAPYKPGADGGIMGMLDVILSDFASLEAETQQAEDIAQSEYEKFMQMLMRTTLSSRPRLIIRHWRSNAAKRS
jgi:chromosome segregation ATPase